MKFPSIKTLAESAGKTIKRFPFEILFALAGTIAATVDIEHDKYNDSITYWCHRIMMGANLGLLLCLATTLYVENRRLTRQITWTIRLIAALAGVGLIFLIDPEKRDIDIQRFFLFSLGFHLLVSFSAFISSKNNVQAFWQFNKTLFLRFLAGVLYTGVLYLGLLAAISATEYLFNLHPNEHIYGLLFAWLAGVFNTTFFLAGVPSDLRALENDMSYPKGLKIFTQYVLIPLATIYVIILLAYEVKIMVAWNLPKGLVSNLILGYAVFGILSILLIYPIRDLEGNKWMKTYSKSFYFLLVPLIILLLLSVFARVLPYGITEERYFLLVLSGWLIFITGYFLLSRKQNIKVIPVTLCIVTLLSIYGPQSAFSVSFYSQRSILIGIFKKYGLFKDGKLMPTGNKEMKANDGKEAVAKLRYLVGGNGMQELQPYISRDLKNVADSLEKESGDNQFAYARSTEASWLITYLGVDKFENGNRWANSISYDFDTGDEAAVDIKGYDVMLPIDDHQYNFNQADTFKVNNLIIRKVTDSLYNSKLFLNDKMVSFNIKQIADSLIAHKVLKPYDPSNRNSDYWKANKIIMVKRNVPGVTVIFAIGKVDISYNAKKALTVSDIKGYYLIKKE